MTEIQVEQLQFFIRTIWEEIYQCIRGACEDWTFEKSGNHWCGRSPPEWCLLTFWHVLATIHPAISAPPHVTELKPLPLAPVYSEKPQSVITPVSDARIPADKPTDAWRIALLGDGGVGKTALAVQVRLLLICSTYSELEIASSLWIPLLVSWNPSQLQHCHC